MVTEHEFQNALDALARGGMVSILADAFIKTEDRKDKAQIEEQLLTGITKARKTCGKVIFHFEITGLLKRKGLSDRILIEALRACGDIGDVKAIAEFNERREEYSYPVRQQIDESFKTALWVCEQTEIGGAIADILNERISLGKYSKIPVHLIEKAEEAVKKIEAKKRGRSERGEKPQSSRTYRIEEMGTTDAINLRERAREAEKTVFDYLRQKTANPLAGDGVALDRTGVMRSEDIPAQKIGLIRRMRRRLFG